ARILRGRWGSAPCPRWASAGSRSRPRGPPKRFQPEATARRPGSAAASPRARPPPCPETAAAPAPERRRPRGPRPGAARAATSRRQGKGRGGRCRQTSAKPWWRASGEEADEQRRGGVRRGADLERVAHPGEQSDTDHRVEGVAGGWSGTLLVKDRQDTLLEGEGHLAS